MRMALASSQQKLNTSRDARPAGVEVVGTGVTVSRGGRGWLFLSWPRLQAKARLVAGAGTEGIVVFMGGGEEERRVNQAAAAMVMTVNFTRDNGGNGERNDWCADLASVSSGFLL